MAYTAMVAAVMIYGQFRRWGGSTLGANRAKGAVAVLVVALRGGTHDAHVRCLAIQGGNDGAPLLSRSVAWGIRGVTYL